MSDVTPEEASVTFDKLMELVRIEIGEAFDERGVPDEWAFVKTDDEKLRCFIVNQVCSSDVEGKIQVENMHRIYEWVKGKDPKLDDKPRKSPLKLVEKPHE